MPLKGLGPRQHEIRFGNSALRDSSRNDLPTGSIGLDSRNRRRGLFGTNLMQPLSDLWLVHPNKVKPNVGSG